MNFQLINFVLTTLLLLSVSVNAKPKVHVDERSFRKKQGNVSPQGLRGGKTPKSPIYFEDGTPEGDVQLQSGLPLGSPIDADGKKHRLFVQYKGSKGHDRAALVADQVLIDEDGQDNMVMACGYDCFNLLKDDDDIELIDHDYPVSAIEAIEVPHRHGERRRLEEEIPWGLQFIGADTMTVSDKKDVLICIADSGLARGHPDLDMNYFNGTNNGEWKWFEDSNGHGTHVAGTIGAKAGNGFGVAGAGKFKIHVTRALDDDGNGSEATVRIAIRQCIEAGANIINLSLGGPQMSATSEALYTDVVQKYKIMLVTASGNSGVNTPFYPASHPDAISVGAIKPNEKYWEWSNYGSQLEICGPGVDILSTTIDSQGQYTYGKLSGTSMASPHYVAAAGLVWSHYPDCTAAQIRVALAASAIDLGSSGCDTDYGHGLVHAGQAYQWLRTRDCLYWQDKAQPRGGCNVVPEDV